MCVFVCVCVRVGVCVWVCVCAGVCVSLHSLAGDVARVVVDYTGRPVAAQAPVRLTLHPLVLRGTHTLHMARAGS